MATQQQLTGCVKWFDNGMNYGFITVVTEGEYKGKDIFVHQSNIKTQRDCFRTLYTGECVVFDLAKSKNASHEYHAEGVSGFNGALLHCENPAFRGGRGGGRGGFRGGRGGFRGGRGGNVRAPSRNFNRDQQAVAVESAETTTPTLDSAPTPVQEETAVVVETPVQEPVQEETPVQQAVPQKRAGRGRGRGKSQ
jgi:cold shock CspA family protein